VQAFRQDIRYGARALAGNPGFALVAIVTLGLGVGANAAIFSVINAVFLRPLPLHEPARLVVMWGNTSTPGNFHDVKTRNSVFQDMAAVHPRDLSLTGDGEPERVAAHGVTSSFFPMIGVAPQMGRVFSGGEQDEPAREVVLSHGLWQRRYGGARDIVGREILLNGEKHAVAGVMPPRFQLMDRVADAWVPMAFAPADLTNRRSHILAVFARLKDGADIGQARAQVRSIMQQIKTDHPQEVREVMVEMHLLPEHLAAGSRMALMSLLTAVGFVLLVVCINIGNLMLSRAAGRSREIAVRAAMGATRGRLIRQMLVENIPLVACGTVVGLLLASLSMGLLRQLVPPGMSQSAEVGLDGRVLAFTLVIALAATILFGLIPAVTATNVRLNEGLRQGSSRTGHSKGGRLQGLLVVGEVCLAIALLVGASLLLQSFFRLRGQFADLKMENVLTLKTVLSSAAYPTHARREGFLLEMVERMRSVPGVLHAGYSNALPLDYRGDSTSLTAEGRPHDETFENEVNTRLVTADYLPALGLSLRQGRHLADADNAASQPVAVVNEALIRKFLPGEAEPLGRRIKVGDAGDETPWMTIVGIVADVRQRGVDAPVMPEMYLPYTQVGYMEIFSPKVLAIRTAGDHAAVISAARRAVAAIDPGQPISEIRTMDQILGHELSARRLGAWLVAAFALAGLLLASFGVYGVLSQRVARMTPEIGVRLALGAQPRSIVAMVVRSGMTLVLVGTAAGLALAFAITRLIASLLFGVGPADPVTYAGVPALLAGVALAACYGPARRAAGVDPNAVLRCE
jgi:putative ABC transport system permease protein